VFCAGAAGQETKASNMTAFRFKLHASYPGGFRGAPQMVPGTYEMKWREQNAKTGKWGIIVLGRVTLSDHDFSTQPPATAPHPGQVPQP
jgi:hypothetical protein